MQCNIKDIVDFYSEFPEEIGRISVLTQYGYKRIEFADITVFNSPVIQVKTIDGKYIDGSPDHQLMTNDGWKSLKNLSIDSQIKTINGLEYVTSITTLPFTEDLYDLQVADVHEFYANGIVSHNSTILSAICYALYGQALTKIKQDNLINSINKKNMVVTIDFEKNGNSYRIERGRKPNFFKFIVNDEYVTDDTTDEAQGENKDTQAEVEQLLGLSHTMFKHIVALNTYTEPFLSLPTGKQREVIEELLGITLLSQKAEKLRELIKTTKTKIEQEEFKAATIKKSNDRIVATISDIETKIKKWNQNKTAQIQELVQSIELLQHLNIDEEIEKHNTNTIYRDTQITLRNLKNQSASKTSHLNQLKREQNTLLSQYAKIENHDCAMCGQKIHDSKQESLLEELGEKITQVDTNILHLEEEINTMQSEIDEIEPLFLQLTKSETFYTTLEQAFDHKNSFNQLEKELIRIDGEINPFQDQLGSLTLTMQEIDYTELNELSSLKDHQEFLLKLLTSKDSFIRKKIIDQNLAYLNSRLNEYLTILNLPHRVKFANDLDVEILYMGQDLDFDQLSRGERTRVIMGLCWAFRDIFENMNSPINFMAVDEMLDQGLDSSGVEKALELLKGFSRDRNKNILLISHRDELQSRCAQVLTVIKEDGFTRFEWNYEAV